MPFTLVITKEGGADAVSAVPSGWVNENTLYWPKTGKKAEIEALRCDENGKFNQKWRKQKCRIKMKNIATFAEATKLEEMYANFEDTEEEEAMDKPLGEEDFAAMEGQLRGCVEADRHYWRVNDVKCDAIHTARTYEEFADRVAAAHLTPLEKADYKQKSKTGWNQYASRDAKRVKNGADNVD